MSVYLTLQLTGGAARNVTITSGGLLPRLFTLTAGATSALVAVVFCHFNPTVAHGFPLRNVMLCVARTFLLAKTRQATSHPTANVFGSAKLLKKYDMNGDLSKI